MLDIIIECPSNHKNLKLREISSESLSEYIKWFIKQNIDIKSVKEKLHTLKYLIRKIESNSLHPDSFKRFGAILCFEKRLAHIINNTIYANFIQNIPNSTKYTNFYIQEFSTIRF